MKIVLAVSGGVDSVAMLHSLAMADGFAKAEGGNDYLVAHFDHGIRQDSQADARFVRGLAEIYGYEFRSKRAELAGNSSEANARKHRWEFLRQVMSENSADAVATAHHKDDVFETQLINLLRGTARRGMTVLQDKHQIVRPLINRAKADIYSYALENSLEFIEDETNQDTSYLRNRLRLKLIPKMGAARKQLESLISSVNDANQEIDKLLDVIVQELVNTEDQRLTIERDAIKQLPPQISREVLREVIDLTANHDKQKLSFDMIKRLDEFARRPDSNKYLDLSKKLRAHITKQQLQIPMD